MRNGAAEIDVPNVPGKSAQERLKKADANGDMKFSALELSTLTPRDIAWVLNLSREYGKPYTPTNKGNVERLFMSLTPEKRIQVLHEMTRQTGRDNVVPGIFVAKIYSSAPSAKGAETVANMFLKAEKVLGAGAMGSFIQECISSLNLNLGLFEKYRDIPKSADARVLVENYLEKHHKQFFDKYVGCGSCV